MFSLNRIQLFISSITILSGYSLFYTYLLPLYSCFYKIYALLTDSFGIILRNQNGEYIEVLEMELDGVWNIIIKIKT